VYAVKPILPSVVRLNVVAPKKLECSMKFIVAIESKEVRNINAIAWTARVVFTTLYFLHNLRMGQIS
jgi:hypothetical protein